MASVCMHGLTVRVPILQYCCHRTLVLVVCVCVCVHSITTSFFSSLSRSIRDSGVTLIEDKAFEDMIQLQDLSLSGNNLGIFKGQVFHGLTKLLQL